MTEAQRKIMIYLKSSKNTFAVKYMKGLTTTYRILTEDRTPLVNAGSRPFLNLIKNGMIDVDKTEIPVKYRLSEAGLKYKIRYRSERTANTI